MAPPRIDNRPLTPPAQTAASAAAPAPKQPANQLASKPAGGDLGRDLGALGHDLVDRLETVEKKAVDAAEHLLPKVGSFITQIAKDLGFDVSDPTPVPGTDA